MMCQSVQMVPCSLLGSRFQHSNYVSESQIKSTCTHTYTHTHSHTHTHTQTHTCIMMYTHVQIPTHTLMHTHTHTYTYTLNYSFTWMLEFINEVSCSIIQDSLHCRCRCFLTFLIWCGSENAVWRKIYIAIWWYPETDRHKKDSTCSALIIILLASNNFIIKAYILSLGSYTHQQPPFPSPDSATSPLVLYRWQWMDCALSIISRPRSWQPECFFFGLGL